MRPYREPKKDPCPDGTGNPYWTEETDLTHRYGPVDYSRVVAELQQRRITGLSWDEEKYKGRNFAEEDRAYKERNRILLGCARREMAKEN